MAFSLKTRGLEDKLRTAESFLATAELLDSIAGKIAIEKTYEAAKARIENQRNQAKIVCHFLYAVVFEIAIKVIWAIDKEEDCRPTHDIFCLYKELSQEKQSRIKKLYDEQILVVKENVKGTNDHGLYFRAEDLAEFRSIEEALKYNWDTMTNFKYEGQFRGKSGAISGVIWNTEIHWILPARFVIFPKQLLAYAKENLESYAAGRGHSPMT